ncbi:GNAT family N-acetyltransferase [Streptosporangium sp. NPDC020145]|uniref:GNAT family N-acetyltransferase n=1 Tax=Streptosporangium sp. NPDC020145 TaxID=3154694 RepID=UPI003422B3D5
MDRVTEPDHPGRVLVAAVDGGLVTVAEYVPGQDGDAELAILIDDTMHHRGLGTLLVEHLALEAADEGVRELVAEVLADNRPMLRGCPLGGPSATGRHPNRTLRSATRSRSPCLRAMTTALSCASVLTTLSAIDARASWPGASAGG